MLVDSGGDCSSTHGYGSSGGSARWGSNTVVRCCHLVVGLVPRRCGNERGSLGRHPVCDCGVAKLRTRTSVLRAFSSLKALPRPSMPRGHRRRSHERDDPFKRQ